MFSDVGSAQARRGEAAEALIERCDLVVRVRDHTDALFDDVALGEGYDDVRRCGEMLRERRSCCDGQQDCHLSGRADGCPVGVQIGDSCARGAGRTPLAVHVTFLPRLVCSVSEKTM